MPETKDPFKEKLFRMIEERDVIYEEIRALELQIAAKKRRITAMQNELREDVRATKQASV